MSGTVDNMEKYKYMLGQAHTCLTILQDISNLLNEKEQKDEKGTVIKLDTKVKYALAEKYDEQNKEKTKEVDAYERLKSKNQINYQDQLVGEC